MKKVVTGNSEYAFKGKSCLNKLVAAFEITTSALQAEGQGCHSLGIRLEQGPDKNWMKFVKDKCRALHQRNNPLYQCKVEPGWPGSSPAEKNLASLRTIDYAQASSVPHSDERVNSMLGCINMSIASTLRELITPLYLALIRL